MPRIFDNIEQQLLPALLETIEVANHADFCVGYFNMRGWKELDTHIEQWSGGEGNCCRLLVGMQPPPQEELRKVMNAAKSGQPLDNQTALRLKKKLAEEFREQLCIGVPTNRDEEGLRRLARQIKEKKVIVKLFLEHPLHAKLYLLFRSDPINPIIGYLGSSNLTFAGLSRQGELNVDVLDHDACKKLAAWFEERWNSRLCLDISTELAKIIDESWAREEAIPPYHIYLKMAYHLSQEAREGLLEFKIPRDFKNKLWEFQVAAVKIAAHHLNKRHGVLIGDVVGLGKTLMASALARIFEDDYDLETLILCPKNLVPMWEDYRDQYRLRAKVLSLSLVTRDLPDLRRYRIVLIDESQNLRSREGKRYKAVREYILKNDSMCILLSATPYNKTYLDLSNQLRLFIPEDKDLGIRPEQLLKEIGETEFMRLHQCSVRSLIAFEKSDHPDDWRDLMRLYMVRRTRGFIQENYAQSDKTTGRKFLTFEDGSRSYFPVRSPKTATFKIDDQDPLDQYAQLYARSVVDEINKLKLPRYGLGNYIAPSLGKPLSPEENKIIIDLSRAGKSLMGFCRTNFFKRLESSGQAFLQSLERHILRNYVFLYALEANQPLPIGTQDKELLDSRIVDEEVDVWDEEEESGGDLQEPLENLRAEIDFKKKGAEIYGQYATRFKKRFKWIKNTFFVKNLKEDLDSDTKTLLNLLQKFGTWNPDKDAKLQALVELITIKHPEEKVLIFSQFADTVLYLETQLKAKGISKLAAVTGDSPDPTSLVWGFSPVSNGKRGLIKPEEELRILISTDVLSEGQNLQDCHIVINYDLPWAIIRLIQRAGRVDRIGQTSENIFCYSFLPAEGVERIIQLRARVRSRLQENAEVVGTDEAFFEDDQNDQAVLDLYNEKSGILDGDSDTEVDLASYAYQIWKNACRADSKLETIIPNLPSVVYSAKKHHPAAAGPEGVLVYLKTSEGNDALAWVNKNGQSVTESQLAILKAAESLPNTPAVPKDETHHELVGKAVELIAKEEKQIGGQLGRPSGARFRVYERLKRYAERIKGTFFETDLLLRVIEEIYRYPLTQAAADTLNRQLKSGVTDETLSELAITLREEGKLSLIHEETSVKNPEIICSMGLVNHAIE